MEVLRTPFIPSLCQVVSKLGIGMRQPSAYFPTMEQTLETRVASLEQTIAQLTARVLQLTPVKKDWQATLGMLPDDELSREAERLGREYRASQQEP
jgi:hypothetical protein